MKRFIWIMGMAIGAFAGACGDDGSPGSDDASVIDAGISDARTDGMTWRLVEVPITSIELADPAPLNSERTVRVAVQAEHAGCDERAMPAVSFAFEVPDAIIIMRAWRPVGLPCDQPSRRITRLVTLSLQSPAMWTIRPGTAGSSAAPLAIQVLAPPLRPCMQGGLDCEMDCDCEIGQACLGGDGLIGPFTQCARPCELDMDCSGGGACISVDDGLDSICDGGQPQCNAQRPCPAGYDCMGDRCTPTFSLNQSTRIECATDADCTAPLRCVEPAVADRSQRCEITCQTGSQAWCEGGHFCGTAQQDISGLAPADSVCVWAGE